MGNNTSRRRAGKSTNNPKVTAATGASSASISQARSMSVPNTQRVRKKYALETNRILEARSTLKAHASTEVMVTLSGSASVENASIQIPVDAHNLESVTSHSSESTEETVCSNLLNKTEDTTINLTNDCGTPICSAAVKDITCIVGSDFSKTADIANRLAQRSSCVHATRKPSADASKATNEKTDIKIATTKAQTSKLTDAQQARIQKTVRETYAASTAASELTKANTTTIKCDTTTAAKPANEQLLMCEALRETIAVPSGALRRTQSAARLTSPLPTTTPILSDAQVEVTLEAVDMKSKFSENKCPLTVLTNVSNQRKVEATSTILISAQCTLNSNSQINHTNNNNINNNHLLSNKWSSVLNTANAEYDPVGTTRAHSEKSSKDIERSLNLAARKAKLKSEFFRDFELHEAASKRLTQSTTIIDVCGKDSAKHFLEKSESNFANLQRDVSGTRPQHLPPTVLPTIAVNEGEPIAFPSIVAKRKLDLKRKFEQQAAPKTSLTSDHHFIVGASSAFSRVEKLVQKFDTQSTSPARKMIVNPNKSNEAADINMLSLKPDVLEQRNSPLSDEGCNLGQSPYSSDNEDNDSTRNISAEVEKSKRKEKVARSASSDSALGLDVDEAMDTTPAQPPTGTQQRRMTLTVTDLPLRPALLPLAEPTALPESPTIDLQQSFTNLPPQNTIPSKVLLEERVVELPEDPRSLAPSQPCSRRESAQSCTSDYTAAECPGGRRFVRTPSVVVSDYSDDVMCGITLEEIEYFRAQRMRRRHSSLDTANEGEGESDVSASSSCSNLYYCGSTISALDGAECYVNGVRTSLDRKTSACSTCSASADEESFTIPEDPQQPNKDLADLLAAQHLSTKPTTKKVGLVVPMNENMSEKATY